MKITCFIIFKELFFFFLMQQSNYRLITIIQVILEIQKQKLKVNTKRFNNVIFKQQ